MAESNIYTARGVSSGKDEVHQAIKGIDQGLFPGAFCKIIPDNLTGNPEYCLLMHADGAGTKSSLAYIYWKETGDISVFKGIAIDSIVMNLDDLTCIGATDNLLLSNTIGRNKFQIPGEIIQAIIQGYEEEIELLQTYGIGIKSCGGETADVGDLVRTVIVDSTITVRMKRSQVIDLDNVQVGDQIIGFSSSGQAKWENRYNSGIGSNGLTAGRHDCLSAIYAEKYPESYSPEMASKWVYCGSSLVTDPLAGTPLNVGQALLSPTRTYAPLIKKMVGELSGEIHGLVHCTGGGQTKCQKFGRGIHYVKDNLFELPPIFAQIKKTRGYSLQEMLPVYNMGHRLEIFVAEKHTKVVLDLAQDCGIDAKIIGYCERAVSKKNELTIKTAEGAISFS